MSYKDDEEFNGVEIDMEIDVEGEEELLEDEVLEDDLLSDDEDDLLSDDEDEIDDIVGLDGSSDY